MSDSDSGGTVPEEVGLLVVGGGKAGKTLAMDFARAGQRVAMVERGMIGGTCINVACIPTKTIIQSGRMLQDARRAREFGIVGVAEPAMSVSLLRRRKEDVVGTMVEGQRSSFIGSGMDFVLGEATFTGERTVEIRLDDGGTRTLRGEEVVINLGTQPLLPQVEGLAEVGAKTSETLLELESLPRSLVILGGGYVGCEFADLLNTIGVTVAIVQGGPQLLAREDPDIADIIEERFTDAGISIHKGARAESVRRNTDRSVTVTLSSGDTVTADDLLVAVGRQPVTAGLNLQSAGIELTDSGFVVVDEHLRTTAPSVWAAGDVAGSPQFTHASYDDYRILKANLEAKARGSAEKRTTAGRLVPYTVFTTPELARVGLTEQQAREQGYDVRIARMPISAIPRARTVGRSEGVWKAVIDRRTDLVLGAALLGTESSEVIAVVQMAMLAGLPFSQLRDAVITHPTMAEGLTLLFSQAFLES